jgi:hypothetical protein
MNIPNDTTNDTTNDTVNDTANNTTNVSVGYIPNICYTINNTTTTNVFSYTANTYMPSSLIFKYQGSAWNEYYIYKSTTLEEF